MSHPQIPPHGASVNLEEIRRFEQLGEQWWDEWGPMRGLHRMNPTRVKYIIDILSREIGRNNASPDRPLSGLRLLDIGCGGGILSEALARLGAEVTGLDPAPGNIEIARRHAEKNGLAIDYRAATVESLAESGQTFDAALALEVVEHVDNRPSFLRATAAVTRPGGFVMVSTLNRNLKSYALAIVAAEYILHWVKRGTHDWRMFVTPEELSKEMRAAGLSVYDQTGFVYHPAFDEWRLSEDCSVNYVMTAEKIFHSK